MAEETSQTDSTNSTTTTTDAPATDAAAPTILGDVKSDLPADDKKDDAPADDAAPKDDADKGGDDKPEGDDKKGDDAPALHGEAPEAYQLTAPEGRTLDPKGMEIFTGAFKELALTNEGAQRLIEPAFAFVDHVTQQVENAMMGKVADTVKGWATEAEADAEIGGKNFEESKALCGRMFDKFGWAEGGQFRTFLDETGLGNHPEMIRAMVKVARATGEDSFERGDSSKGDVPVWDRVYGQPTPAQ